MQRIRQLIKRWLDRHPYIPPLTVTALVVLALALAGCGGGGNQNAEAAKAFNSAIDPTGIGGLSVSCAHDQGTKYTCKISGSDSNAVSVGIGVDSGIYSVTYDPKSKYVYYQKVG